MFVKLVTIVFYLAVMLFAFGVSFPYLMLILGVCAAILAIVHAL
jgi:hypothetical protein